jgi:hypothetical protein
MSTEIREDDLPLADRLITQAIAEWLDVHTNLAIAAAPTTAEMSGVTFLRSVHLDGYAYQLVPKILDSLRQAGLLVNAPGEVEPWALSVICPGCEAPERVWCFDAMRGKYTIGHVHDERRTRAHEEARS